MFLSNYFYDSIKTDENKKSTIEIKQFSQTRWSWGMRSWPIDDFQEVYLCLIDVCFREMC